MERVTKLDFIHSSFFKIKKYLFQQDNHSIIHIGDLGICRAFTRFVLFIPSGTRILITIHGSELKNAVLTL